MLTTGAFLKQSPAFQALNDQTLEALHMHMRIYTLKPGQMLFHRGDTAEAFYVVLHGAIQLVESTPNGRQINLSIFGKGDIFGLLALSGTHPYPHSTYAIDKTTIGAVSSEKGIDLIKNHPDFALLITNLLVNCLHEAHTRIKHLSTEQSDQRLARILLSYAEKFGTERGSLVSIDLTLSQQSLANTLGVTIETVNRTLRQWEQEEWIRCSRQHIDILDMDAIRALIQPVE